MKSSPHRPALTDAGLKPTVPVSAVDEYRNLREMDIADERPLTIYIDSYEIVTLMTLGTNPELLTLGYLRNQNLMRDLREIKSVQVDWEVGASAVTTTSDRKDWKDRLGPRIVTTGCGQGTVYGNIMEDLDGLKIEPLRLRQSELYELLKNLNEYNEVYRTAGAVHGCALCEGTSVRIFIEDVGRHNAVDAIAGKMWLDDISGKGKMFYTTGRLTSEMVIKVAQMQIPVLMSRSGITQMGLKIAQDLGVTLFSRVQNKHFLVFNGAEHIDFDVALPPKLEVARLKEKARQLS